MNAIEDVLTRRVEKVLPNKEGLEGLMGKKKIRLYQGFDPTGGRLHLGHTIGLRKLMEFAKLGHEVIFLFGTGTVLAGDPSGRDSGRKLITQEEIDENIKGWKKQVAPIVDFDKVTIKQNGDWLVPLTLKEIINIASNISAVQLFKREMFQRRIEAGDTVWFHETLYPLLQGYDSVAMDVDLEIGGTDQEFNMLVGRELQKKMNDREKYVLTVPLIVGVDGKQMSKTSGNCVWLDDSPQDMFGKIMRLPDEHVVSYMELLTDIPINKIESLPDNPLENKKLLALDITTQFHGKDKASEAQNHFETTVQGGGAPLSFSTITTTDDSTWTRTSSSSVASTATTTTLPFKSGTLFEICKQSRVPGSNAYIKDVIRQGGVEWNGKKITNPNEVLEIKGSDILKFGKKTFRKII